VYNNGLIPCNKVIGTVTGKYTLADGISEIILIAPVTGGSNEVQFCVILFFNYQVSLMNCFRNRKIGTAFLRDEFIRQFGTDQDIYSGTVKTDIRQRSGSNVFRSSFRFCRREFRTTFKIQFRSMVLIYTAVTLI